MVLKKKDVAVIAITPAWDDEEKLLNKVSELLVAQVPMIQYREKKRQGLAKERLAQKIQKLCQDHGAIFIVNDDVNLAQKLGCGVHLGLSDCSIDKARTILGQEAIIGGTAHNLAEAKAAYQAGANYLGCGAIHPSTTKSDTVPLSLTELSSICRSIPLPVAAIGGVGLEDCQKLKERGASGVALCSALFDKTDGQAWATAFLNEFREMPKALTIAGSDSSGGAGIQADLKTMTSLSVYGMSVVTAITAQNTQGVFASLPISGDLILKQLETTVSDISPDAVKIGMLPSQEAMAALAQGLKQWILTRNIPVVLDPVMIATSGSSLMESQATDFFKRELCPLCTLITPNLYEAEVLSGQKIESEAEMETAAEHILDLGVGAVLIKGGHLKESASDFFLSKNEKIWFRSPRIHNTNTHGTGCTLSSAIASYLARGEELTQACKKAKGYLSMLLQDDLDLGKASGPLNHMAALKSLL